MFLRKGTLNLSIFNNMDIDLLSKMIHELILDKDRVVLPGLGCFMAEMVPSTFSDKGYTINPPYRRLVFRSKPDTGDEIIDFYVEKNGLDRDVACRIIGDFIAELREVIFTKKVVVFPGLGRLRATRENNLFFIADEDLDIYPAGLGLEPVSLKTHVETQQEVSEAVADLASLLNPTPAAEPVEAESITEPVDEPKEEEVVEPASEPVAKPVAELVAESVAEPMVPADVTVGAAEYVEEVTREPMSEAVVDESVDEEVGELPVVEVQEDVTNPAWKKLLLTVVILIAVAALLLAAVAVIGRYAPELIDRILYSPEELEILNRKI